MMLLLVAMAAVEDLVVVAVPMPIAGRGRAALRCSDSGQGLRCDGHQRVPSPA